jgi:hypothetical protein
MPQRGIIDWDQAPVVFLLCSFQLLASLYADEMVSEKGDFRTSFKELDWISQKYSQK